MRAKDLSVGMCVAVKDGTRIKKAWVLEIGTAWYWSYTREWQYRRGLGAVPQGDPKAVAVAFESELFDQLRPDVVQLSQIIGPWDEYTATQKKNQEATQRAYERARRREREFQERFDKLNLSDAHLEANGYVRISLDALETRLHDEARIGEQRDSDDGDSKDHQ